MGSCLWVVLCFTFVNSIGVASGAIVSYFSKKCQILAPSSHYFVNYYPIKVGTQRQLKANICFRLRFRGHMFLIRWYTLKSISTLKKQPQHKYFIMNLACFATDLEQWLMSAYQSKPRRTRTVKKWNHPLKILSYISTLRRTVPCGPLKGHSGQRRSRPITIQELRIALCISQGNGLSQSFSRT